MDDLVERLRRWADTDDMGRKPSPTCLKRQAADRIEALQARIAELESLLQSERLHRANKSPF